MIREQRTMTIDRPVADVFSYLTNVTTFPEWSSAVQKASLASDPPLGEGSTIRESVKLLGRHTDIEMEVTELKANRIFARRSVSGPIIMHIKAELEPEGAMTRVTWTIEAEATCRFALT
jgi:carbon monoxide dehydrogenase subunit G